MDVKYQIEGPKVELPDEQLGCNLFRKLSSRDPKEEFMLNSDTDDGVTVEHFQRKCKAVAISLRRYVSQDDVVVCLCENEWLCVVPLISSLYLGVAISMINSVYTPRELHHLFTLVQPKVIFCKQNVLEKVLELKSELKFIATIILMEKVSMDELTTIYDLMKDHQGLTSFYPTSVDQSRTAVILSSSGTSGLPKAVMLSYSNISAWCLCDKTFPSGHAPGIPILVLIPLSHAAGFALTLHSIVACSRQIFLKKFAPEVFLKLIERFKFTTVTIVPFLAFFMAKSALVDKYDLSSLKDLMCGSAPLPQNILHILQTRLNVKCRQAYGLTETGIISYVRRGFPMKQNSVGTLAPNITAIIKDVDTKKVLPKNSIGEVCVKGPSIFKGYKNYPKETALAFDENGYFMTGDVGYFDDDDHLYIIDRLKDVIKYKGFQVAASELEGILLTHPAVRDVAVIGVPDERAGELPCAVVAKQPDVEVTEEELVNYLKGKVCKYKELSGGVRFVDNIPKNPIGKMLKMDVKKMIIGNNN